MNATSAVYDRIYAINLVTRLQKSPREMPADEAGGARD